MCQCTSFLRNLVVFIVIYGKIVYTIIHVCPSEKWTERKEKKDESRK